MVNEQALSSVLREFARTLVTDFSIQVVLDRLVEGIVEALPVTAAGITLLPARTAPHTIAASDDVALRYERQQTEITQSPCRTEYVSGMAVSVADGVVDEQFTRRPSDAVAIAATFSFPLRRDDEQLGALNLYRDVAGELDRQDMEAGQTLADVAAAYVLNAQARADRRAGADRVRHDALHDPVTGLPNRLLLAQRLEHVAQRASRSPTSAAVLFADLDRFKRVNQAHGHGVGDELLRAVAGRLSSLVCPGDTLARVSADEFVFLCAALDGPADAEVFATRIGEAFATPFELAGTELMVSASVGIAFAGPGEEVSSSLVVKAELAMLQVKGKGGASHQVIDLRAVDESSGLADLERDLRTAFGEDRLDVAYQPIVNSADGVVTGVEALLRWGDPDHAAVSPMAMVRVAEQTRLINDIGAWVMERACGARGRWLQEHPESPLDLAVNVSGRQLMDPDFAATVAGVLTQTGMDAGALVLEMTEDVLIEDSARSKQVLADLRELGVRLALDDFGTGYSSLSYLRRLPVQIVKIDQSFIADISHSPTGGTILAAVTDLAHVLGLSVIAEGVETESQRDRVSAIGCEAAQGFFYARPMSAAAISSRLRATPTGPPNRPAAPLRLPGGQPGRG